MKVSVCVYHLPALYVGGLTQLFPHARRWCLQTKRSDEKVQLEVPFFCHTLPAF